MHGPQVHEHLSGAQAMTLLILSILLTGVLPVALALTLNRKEP